MRTQSISRRSGFTLVELAFVAVILALSLAAIGGFESSNRRVLAQTAAVGSAQERAHRALERALDELQGASIATLVPDPSGALGSDEIVFQKSSGVDSSGAVIWSPRTRIALELEDGEALDGADDDGNGLVDERKLTITYDFGGPAARTLVLVHLVPALSRGEFANGIDDDGNGVVDESGFNVQRLGNLLSVRLAVQARGERGVWTAWSETTALRLRD